MGILKNLKRRLGMAKRFKGGIKEEVVEEIAKRVAEEDIEEMIEIKEDIPEDKMSKEEFLISKGMQERPNSIMALTAWEEYKAS